MTSLPSPPSLPPSSPPLPCPPLPSPFAKQVGHTKNVTIGLAKVGQSRLAKIGLCTPDDARQIAGNDKSSNATSNLKCPWRTIVPHQQLAPK